MCNLPRLMSTLVIINKTAAKAHRAWSTIKPQLAACGHYELYETTAPGDATTRTREALRAGTEIIVVVGGDGTLSETVEGFFDFNNDARVLPARVAPGATLAILPAGTGDDFARGVCNSRAPLQTWIETLIAFKRGTDKVSAKPVDVLYGACDDYTKPFTCLNASTLGIGGETALRVLNQGKLMRNFPGEFRFLAAAFGALAGWRERRVRVTVDEHVVSDDQMNLVAVANSLYAGGGMMITPAATTDDGRLDVLTACRLTRMAVVRELSRVHTGGHLKNSRVKVFQGASVEIETFSSEDAMPIEADGNVRGVTSVRFSVMPRALNFVVPQC